MDCCSIFSQMFGGKSTDGGGESSVSQCGCCCEKVLGMIKNKFDLDVAENDKGIGINISPKDPNKKEALQDLFRGIKEIFCECCGEGKSESESDDAGSCRD